MKVLVSILRKLKTLGPVNNCTEMESAAICGGVPPVPVVRMKSSMRVSVAEIVTEVAALMKVSMLAVTL